MHFGSQILFFVSFAGIKIFSFIKIITNLFVLFYKESLIHKIYLFNKNEER
jgi:hypothetical protein